MIKEPNEKAPVLWRNGFVGMAGGSLIVIASHILTFIGHEAPSALLFSNLVFASLVIVVYESVMRISRKLSASALDAKLKAIDPGN